MNFEEKLLTRLRQLLVEVDLTSTTERQLRKSLEAEFDTDLSGYKAVIRQCVNDYLASTQAEEEEEEEEGEEETDDEVRLLPPSYLVVAHAEEIHRGRAG